MNRMKIAHLSTLGFTAIVAICSPAVAGPVESKAAIMRGMVR
jgi:hypothetical protein